MQSVFDLTGKVAIITGGSRGIGKAIAHAYARAGAAIVIAGRTREPLEGAAEELRAQGADAMAVPTHCGRPEQIDRLIEAAAGAYGRVDILVNNAATSPHFGPLVEATDDLWRKTLEVNLLGYFHAARRAAEAMAEDGGKIINVSSIAAAEPLPGLGVYGVTKAAVTALTRTLALELGRRNIQVNALAPGLIRTSFSRALWDDERMAETALARIPARRFGEVEDLIGAALLLASPAADYMTGVVLTVDGGYSVS